MRVTFIHNPSAGEGSRADADEILALIRAAGHQVTYQSAHEKNWHAALKQPADLVAVAGGDGTVSKVSRRLVGQHMPVAVLPRGTANNLAHTLDLMDIPLPELIAGWATARHVPFDVGVATCPWDEEYFLESVGIGLFAWTTSRFDQSGEQGTEGAKNRHEELRDARRFLRERLSLFAPQGLQVRLDGRELSGEFLLLEAMNIRSIGPNLFLNPTANPGDGLLDVVFVRAEEQHKLNEHFQDQPRDDQDYPNLLIHRGKHLQMQGKGVEFHLDDRIWPDQDQTTGDQSFLVEVRVDPQALVFLVPA